MSLRQNVFRNLAKLAFWSYSVQVKDHKVLLDPSWPRFCCLRCFFQQNLPKKFLFWKLSYFKCTTKKNVNNVCLNSRKWHLAQQKFHMSFIKKALWNNAHAGHHYPRAANNWKFYLWRWEENMYTVFCEDIFWFETSLSNENLQRGYQLNSSFLKHFILYACFTFAFHLLLADPDPGP